MLGEIVASQAGSAREHDVRLMRALGHQHGEGADPVRAGVPGGPLHRRGPHAVRRRSQWAVYRDWHGPAGLMMSGAASDQFVSYDLGNTASPEGDRDLLGWGISAWDVLPWGTYGFASLSMGRDRYAEYAAQRLARCVDKLLFGHLQAGNPASSTEQLDSLLSSQWQAHCGELGLPANPGDEQTRTGILGRWIGSTPSPPSRWPPPSTGSSTGSCEGICRTRGHDRGSGFRSSVRLFATRARTSAGMRRRGLRNGVQLAPRVRRAGRTDGGREIATMGLPYARELVDRLRRHIDDVLAPGVAQLGRWARPTSSRCRRKWMRRCARCAG